VRQKHRYNFADVIIEMNYKLTGLSLVEIWHRIHASPLVYLDSVSSKVAFLTGLVR
jgi:hypothetical protein